MDVLDKKPFNETKVGKLLSNVLPDKGITGILKGVLDLDDTLSPEDKEKAAETLLKAYEAEVSDRDSARKREIEIVKAGKKDWLFSLTGVVGLASFAFAIYAIVYEPTTKDNDLFIHLLGLLEGIVVSNIFAYYFGTSMKENK